MFLANGDDGWCRSARQAWAHVHQALRANILQRIRKPTSGVNIELGVYAPHRARIPCVEGGDLRALLACVESSSPTTTEAQLWQELRGSRLGVAFRRQVPIGRYIVDFCAPSVRLVVEVDGGYHQGRSGADQRRDRVLARRGWRVLRLPVEQVNGRMAEAIAAVRAALAGA